MITSPTLHSAALGALETAINQALKLDPSTRAALAGLEGKLFRLEISGTGLDIFIMPLAEGVQLSGQFDGNVDTHVNGTITDFVELITSDDAPSTLINGGITLQGDSAPLLELQSILHKLDLDWESALADVIGDVPAHQIGRLARKGINFGRKTADSLQRQIDEYLHEEARVLPTSTELKGFYEDVTKLNLAAERLDARVQRMQKKLDELHRRKRD